MTARFNSRVLYTLLSAVIILAGSIVAIRYAQGYRPNRSGTVQGTGLLVANSFPTGAEVYVNDKLLTATDDTVYLEPGEYQVRIQKDGYSPWEKNLRIEQELVSQTNAQLFKRVPSLLPLTFTGLENIMPSPDGEKLLYYTASGSSQLKNGLYLVELSSNLLNSQREPRQISDDPAGYNLAKANFVWSPDNSQVLVSTVDHSVLLDVSKKSTLATLTDVTFQKKQLLSQWEAELYTRERQFFAKFPPEMQTIASMSAKNVYLSPDKKKMLYTATASAIIPENLQPPLLASNTQVEERTLIPGKTYVYDREEDKNFALDVPSVASQAAARVLLANDLYKRDATRYEASPSAFTRLQASTSAEIARNFGRYYSSWFSSGVQWFPDSKHVFFADQDRIFLVGYDDTNRTPVYSGPFANQFVYPWPDGSKLLIQTTFSSSSPTNLYAIELK